ncbi:DNA-directed RNA polymerase subunit alpha C-terminal domain-containing protein [Devosia sp.]|uniref:DNA-directed RNA polymerase subunit alpha C-terminal domain-containing protein n=1 Tax=Devosia sp. TaxID=1871048 RepID=UPI00344E5674
MPTRLIGGNSPTNLEIQTVSDLAGVSLGNLLKTQNFGRKSVANLMAGLEAPLPKGRPFPGQPDSLKLELPAELASLHQTLQFPKAP